VGQNAPKHQLKTSCTREAPSKKWYPIYLVCYKSYVHEALRNRPQVTEGASQDNVWKLRACQVVGLMSSWATRKTIRPGFEPCYFMIFMLFPIWLWVNTYRYIFSGMNIHLPAILMFTRGTRFWHTAISFGGSNLMKQLELDSEHLWEDMNQISSAS
jgi:hypothetical protein